MIDTDSESKPLDVAPAEALEASALEATPVISQSVLLAATLTLPPGFGTAPAHRLASAPPAIRPGRGVSDLAKPAQFKVGIVSIQEGRTPKTGRGFWGLRYTDPSTGKEIKRRVSGLNRDEVRAIAEHLTGEAYQGRGYLPGRATAPSLADGLAQAIELARANAETKASMGMKANLFKVFMAERFPAVKTWGDIRPGHVETYVRHLEGKGLAFDSVRLRLVPVKSAWRRMNRDFPELVKPLAPIRLAERPRQTIDCLDAREVAALLDWLKVHKPNLWPMGCLSALCGLRMLEAAALRIQDVDFTARTVTVTDTGLHKPKTAFSYRTVPVCGEVLDALKAAVSGQKVRPVTGELFGNRHGEPWTMLALTHRWTYTLRDAARELGNPRFSTVLPRKLRASFVTMAGRMGLPDWAIKAYIGHAPGDVLGGHYRRIDASELRLVSEAFGGWRTALEGAEDRKQSGNIAEIAFADA